MVPAKQTLKQVEDQDQVKSYPHLADGSPGKLVPDQNVARLRPSISIYAIIALTCKMIELQSCYPAAALQASTRSPVVARVTRKASAHMHSRRNHVIEGAHAGWA